LRRMGPASGKGKCSRLGKRGFAAFREERLQEKASRLRGGKGVPIKEVLSGRGDHHPKRPTVLEAGQKKRLST